MFVWVMDANPFDTSLLSHHLSLSNRRNELSLSTKPSRQRRWLLVRDCHQALVLSFHSYLYPKCAIPRHNSHAALRAEARIFKTGAIVTGL